MAQSNMQPAGPKGSGPDTDKDGMSDEYERTVWHTDPNNPDSDGDGLSDLAEWWVDTDPNQKDTDGDGWEDGEDLVFGDPLRQNAGGKERAEFLKHAREIFDKEGSDRDGDFVRDHLEKEQGTRPDLRDTDNDGLDDRLETQLRHQDVDVNPTGDPGDRSDLDAARQRLDERREATDAIPHGDASSQVEPVDHGVDPGLAMAEEEYVPPEPVAMVEDQIESDIDFEA
ncbi:MAG: hypothetical protein ACJ71Z_07185 [Aeromicrobium sp.]